MVVQETKQETSYHKLRGKKDSVLINTSFRRIQHTYLMIQVQSPLHPIFLALDEEPLTPCQSSMDQGYISYTR